MDIGLITYVLVSLLSLILLNIFLSSPFILRQLFGKERLHHSEYVVIVTGCDTGFGAMIAIALTKLGFVVIATTLTKEGYDLLTNQVNHVIMCDVTKDNETEKFGSKASSLIQEKKLKLWAIINNAGIAEGGCLDWTSMEIFQKTMNVNYFGIIRIIKATLPLLKQSPSSRIINISSAAGVSGGPTFGPYSGSKHAVEGFSKCLRAELYGWDIHVVNINPSFMKTPLLNKAFENITRCLEAAPENIRTQYRAQDLQDLIPFVEKSSEDPVMVVKVVMEVLTDKRPCLNYYVGTTSHVIRILNLFPPILQEWITRNTGPSFGPTKSAVTAARQLSSFKS